MASQTIDASATPPVPTAPPSHDAISRTNRRWAIGWLLVAGGLWAFYNFALESMPEGVQDLVTQWLPLTAVNEAIVWVICAIGLNIVVGYAGLLDLGFVAFWAIGGYCAGWFMSFFLGQYDIKFHFLSAAPPDQTGIHINWWIVLAIAGAVCAFFGILIGAPTLRLKSDYLAIVTLGFGEIIPQVFVNGEDIAGFNLSNGTKGITPLDPITALPFGPDVVSRPLGPFDLSTKFLLFSIGMQFSFRTLYEMRKNVLIGGSLQVLLTIIATMAISYHDGAIRISIGMCRRMNPLLSSFSPGTTVFRYFRILKSAYPTDPV